MSEKAFTKVKKGVVKRKKRRVLGVFIDGTGLDRATRRLHKRVDMPALVRGVSAGTTPIVARYYTLVPYEDDSRQRAFLDAVRRAGLQVVVKRLPPKGISRQVSVEVEMASDIIAFGMGQNHFEDIGFELPPVEEAKSSSASPRGGNPQPKKGIGMPRTAQQAPSSEKEDPNGDATEQAQQPALTGEEERIATVVCPGRDLTYPLSLLRSLDIQTVSADFGQASSKELIKSASKWIDLSDSETIWRED